MNRIRIISAILATGLLCCNLPAQVLFTPRDSVLAESALSELAERQDELLAGDMIELMALHLLGTPYVGGTLDEPAEETLTVSLTRTDCILFVETCFNLALAAREGKTRWEDLCGLIRQSRYRTDSVRCYADRIHYTTEWLRKGQARELLTEINLGNVPYEHHPINFMSRHAELYPRMDDVDAIRAVEDSLNRKVLCYLPKEEIRSMEMEFMPGDIICFVSGTPGLDISHVAITHVHDGIVGFIHASSTARKVIIDPKSIAEYAASRSSCKGIQIWRAVF